MKTIILCGAIFILAITAWSYTADLPQPSPQYQCDLTQEEELRMRILILSQELRELQKKHIQITGTEYVPIGG